MAISRSHRQANDGEDELGEFSNEMLGGVLLKKLKCGQKYESEIELVLVAFHLLHTNIEA